ncbi:MAG: pilus assembly protein [Rhizobiales bacterium 24-66-13]|jgi:enoyl-CoA hydratase/carnithine racemase|nr:MAG: pilus assembly protein [Rhizobiales bacterium 35-66-30]OYZ77093.1 MAG: pilus assembly protein [Rhizobiales bacterium 24-66-13]OZB06701.1 MAG: pilus assembly protein [Rhizobiales bacterium 39-66-18]HQS47281.1 TraC family protein [Xanthobacteraceae bacterium]
MRVKSSLSEIDAQIEKLRERKKLLMVKAGERFARAAAKAGLVEMEIPDEELDTICEEIAARFRKGSKGKGTAGPSAPSADRSGTRPLGTAAKSHHE